jgi:TolB-like protein
MAFFKELRRRRVTQVAIAYGVVSWAITEVLATVLPALSVPDWTITFIIICLLVGFPIAMVLAWIFDVGPNGIERTEPAAADPQLRNRYRVLYVLLTVVAMAGLGYLLYARGVNPSIAAGPRDSIAVLPFVNLTGDPAKEYFSDGMSEELLNLLVEVPGLDVAARTSSFAYKGQNVDVRKVARDLGVASVLEGSVRQADDRVRITAQLIDAETGFHLWSDTYDRKLEDIFSVQDEIAAAIVDALKIELAGRTDADAGAQHAKPTENVEAYQLYLQGRYFWKRRGADNVRRAIDLYQQALGRDPGFARAHAALASAWVVLPGYAVHGVSEPAQPEGGKETKEEYERAVAAARQALALDANLAEAHAVLAQVNADRGNWLDAEAGFFFATSLDPSEPTPHHWYSILLRTTGRLDAALEQAEKAYEMDPTSAIIAGNLAIVYSVRGDDAAAERYNALAMELGLSKFQTGIAATAAIRQGDYDIALESLQAQFKGQIPPHVLDVVRDYFRALGDPALRPAVLATMRTTDLTPIRQTDLVIPYTEMGDVDHAIELLFEAVAEPGPLANRYDIGNFWIPEAAPIRQHPSFPEVARAAGLADYWKQYGYADACEPADNANGFTCH